jgi:hypothetical protein
VIRLRTLFNPTDRSAILARFHRVRPETPARWGKLTASRMLTHLSDQVRHALGDASAKPISGPLRWPVVRQLAMFWIPWPKGRAKGPPEAFQTQPTEWATDLQAFERLVERFAAEQGRTSWPEHALFGPMTGPTWAKFSYRHFDYHLRQFGA